MSISHYTKSFYADSHSKGIEPGLFYVTLYILLLHFRAEVWRGMLYLQTDFTREISPF